MNSARFVALSQMKKVSSSRVGKSPVNWVEIAEPPVWLGGKGKGDRVCGKIGPWRPTTSTLGGTNFASSPVTSTTPLTSATGMPVANARTWRSPGVSLPFSTLTFTCSGSSVIGSGFPR